jgi:outer membrane lipoprotein SlyB
MPFRPAVVAAATGGVDSLCCKAISGPTGNVLAGVAGAVRDFYACCIIV